MDTWLVAIVGAAATVGGAVVQAFGKDMYESFRYRDRQTPDLGKLWKATWYVDMEEEKPVEERLYIEDQIEIIRQRGLRFRAEGIDPRNRPKNGRYPIIGRFNSHGVVSFSYDFHDVNCPLVGGGLLKRDILSKEFSGRWYGFVEEGFLVSGRVIWNKVN